MGEARSDESGLMRTYVVMRFRCEKELPMSRLTIDMNPRQHQNLKATAALEGKTIKQYALERLFPNDAGNEQAWRELKRLLQERIDAGLAGQVSTASIPEILDEELPRSDA